jgi:hypothetical protein
MGLTTDRNDECIKLIRPDGMQECYLILPPEERAKGFVRPVRQDYVHLKCGVVTHMALAIAETYARNPAFYGGTYCVGCRTHFDLTTPHGANIFLFKNELTREQISQDKPIEWHFRWDPDDGSFVGE